jgi:hypothetical protein
VGVKQNNYGGGGTNQNTFPTDIFSEVKRATYNLIL